jgi:hypothetical protein
MKTKQILGALMFLPLVMPLVMLLLSMLLSTLGIIAGRSDYEKWLFEKVIFPVLEWAHGSYYRALILLVSLLHVGAIWLMCATWCFLDTHISPRPMWPWTRTD